ncbi:2'-5' RNA ligase family protein [Pedobacter aquatilis]|uniref:2'-5' RNA ligase family protein n=1 Tax=Pedobacter aquatilis TaxID=351343 RepID=UPI0025B3B6E9|nr:2'-5' RNA ligase family protein [Pedobacter aquatilis]MDN3588164.1 2'-5' RNA ligase family protein [Pedobacter aquatilis]
MMENLFLVCIVPPISIVEDIDVIRNEISEKYQLFQSLKRPAHITLYNPVKISSLEKEKQFFSTLENAAFSTPFSQVIKNFNSFPQHTIYIDVEQNESLVKLQSQIKRELKPLNLLDEKNNFKFTPHLTIAFKDVKPHQYAAIMDEYQNKNFKRTFDVNHFSVYKHIDKRWQPFKEIPFKNPNTKPGLLNLFS